jgi:hypothetical protein
VDIYSLVAYASEAITPLPSACNCNGYTSPYCQTWTCGGIDQANPNVCGGNGVCSAYNSCECPNLWTTNSTCQVPYQTKVPTINAVLLPTGSTLTSVALSSSSALTLTGNVNTNFYNKVIQCAVTNVTSGTTTYIPATTTDATTFSCASFTTNTPPAYVLMSLVSIQSPAQTPVLNFTSTPFFIFKNTMDVSLAYVGGSINSSCLPSSTNVGISLIPNVTIPQEASANIQCIWGSQMTTCKLVVL